MLVLKVVNGDEALRWDDWNFTCFWIRVFNLPYDGIFKETGVEIGDGIGKFVDVNIDKIERCLGNYMRLQAQIDVSKPFRKGAKVRLGSTGATVRTVFQYEQLSDFYFGCGQIGHGRLECGDERVRTMKSSDHLLYSLRTEGG